MHFHKSFLGKSIQAFNEKHQFLFGSDFFSLLNIFLLFVDYGHCIDIMEWLESHHWAQSTCSFVVQKLSFTRRKCPFAYMHLKNAISHLTYLNERQLKYSFQWKIPTDIINTFPYVVNKALQSTYTSFR